MKYNKKTKKEKPIIKESTKKIKFALFSLSFVVMLLLGIFFYTMAYTVSTGIAITKTRLDYNEIFSNKKIKSCVVGVLNYSDSYSIDPKNIYSNVKNKEYLVFINNKTNKKENYKKVNTNRVKYEEIEKLINNLNFPESGDEIFTLNKFTEFIDFDKNKYLQDYKEHILNSLNSDYMMFTTDNKNECKLKVVLNSVQEIDGEKFYYSETFKTNNIVDTQIYKKYILSNDLLGLLQSIRQGEFNDLLIAEKEKDLKDSIKEFNEKFLTITALTSLIINNSISSEKIKDIIYSTYSNESNKIIKKSRINITPPYMTIENSVKYKKDKKTYIKPIFKQYLGKYKKVNFLAFTYFKNDETKKNLTLVYKKL